MSGSQVQTAPVRPGGPPRPTRPRWLPARGPLARPDVLALLVVLASSIELQWVGVQTVTHAQRFTLLQVPVLGVAVVVAMAGAAIAFVVESTRRQPRFPLTAAFAGAVLVTTAVVLLVCEVLAVVAGTMPLPSILQRYLLHAHGAPGLWLAMATAALLLAAALAPRPTWHYRGAMLRFVRRRSPAMLTLATAAVAWGIAESFLRYRPWVSVTDHRHAYPVAGWVLPWVGPLTLLTALSFLAGGVLLLTRFEFVGLFALAAAGWLQSSVVAVVLVVGVIAGALKLSQWVPVGATVAPRFTVDSVVWASAVLAWAIMAVAVASLLGRSPSTTRVGP